MYGNGTSTGLDRNAAPSAAPPIEPVSSINQNTISSLSDASMALSNLLSKVRGLQPESGNGKPEKQAPERHVMSDARNIRELAGDIVMKVQELHNYIGHDK